MSGKSFLILMAVLSFVAAVACPVCLFTNTPPFDTDKMIYRYEPISFSDSIYSLPSVKDGAVDIVRSSSPIENPEQYGYRFLSEEVDTVGNFWFFGTLPILVGFIILGVVLLSKA